jgi:CRP/FNR family transcriptional regulator, cyclic AMP receptor protein
VSTQSEYLAEVPLFSLLDDQERAVLAERLDQVQMAAGSMVFSFGDPGESLYIVRSGTVEIFFKNATGERIILETAKAGDFFGEISLLDGGPRTASALVKDNLDALVIDRGDLDEFLRLRPEAAIDLLAATGRRLRETTRILRNTATRNINEEMEDKRTTVMKAADWIAEFSGSIAFLFIHCVLFFIWIVLNAGPLPGLLHFEKFDPFPFGLLTMAVSLEAIILSVFVLLSQNRQVARDRVRNDIEYDVNLKAELQIAHMHEKVDNLQAELLARINHIEKSVCPPAEAMANKASTA